MYIYIYANVSHVYVYMYIFIYNYHCTFKSVKICDKKSEAGALVVEPLP